MSRRPEYASSRRVALRTTAIYAAAAATWIVASDKVLDAVVDTSGAQTLVSILKGLAFVCVTAALLYVLLRRAAASIVRSEQEARESQARFQRLAESAPDLVFRYRLLPEPGFEYVSPSASSIVGYTPEEHYADPDLGLKIVHPDDRHLLEAAHERPTAEPIVLRWVRRDGSVRWTELRSIIITDEDGAAVAIEGIARDVTDAIAAEEALRASEERYRSLFENAQDVIATIDSDGRLTSINARGEELTGYTRAELATMDAMRLVKPESRQVARERLGALLSGSEETATYAVEIVTKHGVVLPLEVSSRVVRRDGSPAGVEVIARDVSERRELEAQLLQSQKMEAVGRLAGGVAHDFNNLLTTIGGYGEFLLQSLDEDDPRRRDAEEIAKATARAEGLTRQLLSFSRRSAYAPSAVDLGEVVAGFEPMIGRLVGEDVELATVAAAPGARVMADPTHLEQILLNLVVNARDAMPQGGRLEIETVAVDVNESFARLHPGLEPGPHVLLTVADTGHGMDEPTRSRIFEPFFTTKGPDKGTGLGLATVYGIVQQSGGHIAVDSEPGRGTRFSIYLPRTEAAGRAGGAAGPPADHTGSETILIVEDDEAVRALACRALRERGYEVIEARDADEALALGAGRAAPVALLLTDVVMPGTSGPELAARLRRDGLADSVLFMSGYAGDTKLPDELADGTTTALIEKPFTPERLAAKVREVLDSATARP